jgi:regulatory protein
MTNVTPTITAIVRQKRRPRADLYLDGTCALTIGLELIAERGLGVGDPLPEALRRELEMEDQRRGATAAALRSLAVQPRSEQDLRDRLTRRAFPRHAINAAVERMQELGYLNDVAFARFWVEARQAATPRSRRALAFELGRKGVNRELAAETTAGLSDEDAAFEAAQRRLRTLRGLDRATFTRRLGSFLASRGFSYGVARKTVDRCWEDIAADVVSDAG